MLKKCISENMRQIQFYSPTDRIHLRFKSTQSERCAIIDFNWWLDDDPHTAHSNENRLNLLMSADELKNILGAESRENSKKRIDFSNLNRHFTDSEKLFSEVDENYMRKQSFKFGWKIVNGSRFAGIWIHSIQHLITANRLKAKLQMTTFNNRWIKSIHLF